MTHAAAHLLDSISNRINENQNLGNTAGGRIHNRLCANYGDGKCCTDQWEAYVDVELCSDGGHGGSFYVYRFDEPEGCTMAFCVEDHPNGINGEI